MAKKNAKKNAAETTTQAAPETVAAAVPQATAAVTPAPTPVVVIEKPKRMKEYSLVSKGQRLGSIHAPSFLVAAEAFAAAYEKDIDPVEAEVQLTDKLGNLWRESVRSLLNKAARAKNPDAPRAKPVRKAKAPEAAAVVLPAEVIIKEAAKQATAAEAVKAASEGFQEWLAKKGKAPHNTTPKAKKASKK